MSTTLDDYLADRQTCLGVSEILKALASGCIRIASEIRRAPLHDMLGSNGTVNVFEEDVQKLDVRANEILVRACENTHRVSAVASEEMTRIHCVPKDRAIGDYLVTLDPVDGSSNLDVNVNVGTIFAVYKRKGVVGRAREHEFLRPPSEIVVAGYAIYGPATALVYSAGEGLHGFLLDPESGAFHLVNEAICTPDTGGAYSVNESYYTRWSRGIQSYVDHLKSGSRTSHTSRYIGSLVADFHRNLLKGGVFLYPEDSTSPRGKLRLLYEAGPLAYLVEQAGGRASDGKMRILDKVPESLDERTPLIIGNKRDVEEAEAFITGGKRPSPCVKLYRVERNP